MYTQVKYEYAPRKFAFGQLDGDSPRGQVRVKWITRRRHLPKTIDSIKLRYGSVVGAPKATTTPLQEAVFGAKSSG